MKPVSGKLANAVTGCVGGLRNSGSSHRFSRRCGHPRGFVLLSPSPVRRLPLARDVRRRRSRCVVGHLMDFGYLDFGYILGSRGKSMGVILTPMTSVMRRCHRLQHRLAPPRARQFTPLSPVPELVRLTQHLRCERTSRAGVSCNAGPTHDDGLNSQQAFNRPRPKAADRRQHLGNAMQWSAGQPLLSRLQGW
jgi:hypothetical protein